MSALKKMFSMFNAGQRLKLFGMSLVILGGAGMELVALYAFNNFIEAIMLPDSYMDNAFIAFMCLSLIHISEPTRRTPISYAVFCLKKKKRRTPISYDAKKEGSQSVRWRYQENGYKTL